MLSTLPLMFLKMNAFFKMDNNKHSKQKKRQRCKYTEDMDHTKH